MLRKSILAVALGASLAVGACTSEPAAKFACPGDGVEASPSPPEGRIVWSSQGAGGPCIAIYTMRPDGTGIRRLTPPAFYLPAAPSWSPNGQLIAFTGQCDTEERTDLCVMNSDGADRRTVAVGPVVTYQAATWSPDGTRLAFTRPAIENGKAVEGHFSTHVIAVDGTGETTLVDHGEDPAWSPHGDRIAFVSDEGGSNRIYLVNPDGADVVRITDGPDDLSPAWSPDGGRIAFASGRAGKAEFLPDSARRNPDLVPPTNVRPARPANDIYVMQADGTNATRLTADPSDNVDPTWSPNGDRIAFSSVRDGDYELYVMNADGTGVSRLTHLERGPDTEPSWTR